jgi:purine nucleosidase
MLVRLARERAGELTLVTLGPLTNIALAVEGDPAFAMNVAECFVMGGSARRGGNALPLGEANVARDPIAAQLTVGAGWARSPMLVGLDVTLEATLTPAEFALLAEHRNDAARFLDAPLRFYREFGSTFTAPDTPCHDLLAVLAVSLPAIIEDAPVLPLAVDCGGGAAWGTTVVDLRAPFFAALEGSTQPAPHDFTPWRVALGVDVPRFRCCARRLFGEP